MRKPSYLDSKLFHHNSKEFTLFEIMLAMFIFMLAIIFVSNIFGSSNRHIANARDEAIAFELCAEGVEWFSAMKYGELEAIIDDSSTLNSVSGKFGISINDSLKNLRTFYDDTGNPHYYINPNLKLKDKSGKFKHDYIIKKFKRKVIIERSGDSVIWVRCQVQFTDGNKPHDLELGNLVVNDIFK